MLSIVVAGILSSPARRAYNLAHNNYLTYNPVVRKERGSIGKRSVEDVLKDIGKLAITSRGDFRYFKQDTQIYTDELVGITGHGLEKYIKFFGVDKIETGERLCFPEDISEQGRQHMTLNASGYHFLYMDKTANFKDNPSFLFVKVSVYPDRKTISRAQFKKYFGQQYEQKTKFIIFEEVSISYLENGTVEKVKVVKIDEKGETLKLEMAKSST